MLNAQDISWGHTLLTSILHAQTRCRSVHECGFTTGQKTLENQDWASRLQAAGPSQAMGRGPLSLRAVGPLTGPWRAAGRWAVGLLLAKP